MSDPKRCYCCDTDDSKTWRKSKRWAEGEPLCNACGTAELRGKTMKEVRAKKAAKELEPTPVPQSADDDQDIDIGTGSPEQLDIEKKIEKTLPPPLVLTSEPAPKKRGRPKKEVTAGLEEKDPLAPAPKAKKEKAVKALKEALKELKPEKVKVVKEPKVAKPPKPEKAPKPPKVKIPKEPKVKKERTKPAGRKRVVRTADNLPAEKECPKCKKVGPLEEIFGTRLMNEKVVPQSQCRACRREAAAITNAKKKVGNEKFNKVKEAKKAAQAKKVVSKPLNRGTKAAEAATDSPAVKAPKVKKAGPKVTMPEPPPLAA